MWAVGCVLPDGGGTSRVFAEWPQIPYILTYVDLSARMLPCLLSCQHFPVKVHQRESRHFCDDPVCPHPVQKLSIKIHQRGVQWKQAVVIYMMLYTSLLYDTTPIHCTPLPLHPPVMHTQQSVLVDLAFQSEGLNFGFPSGIIR